MIVSPGRLAGFGLLFAVVAISTAAPLLAAHDPLVQNTPLRLLPPVWAGGSSDHFLGTDALGRDVLSRLMFGGRISLLVGFTTVAVAGTAGLMLGLLSGYIGGFTDRVIQTIAYVQLSMPTILVAIAIIAVFGSGLVNIILVLALAGWVSSCRLVRGLVLSTRERQFVEAARSVGASHMRIAFRHVLPQVLSPFLVLAALQVGWMIIFESALSFLGVGIQPPTPTWGSMISDGREYVYVSPWLSVIPGVAIAATVLSINAVGRWIADMLDPRMRR